MLCALIRHIAGLWSSHFRQHISSKKDYMEEDLLEQWLCDKGYIDVENPLSNVAGSPVTFTQLHHNLQFTKSLPKH